ncbi:MAG: sensor histidine kinase, partial [Flaviramulus sp.]
INKSTNKAEKLQLLDSLSQFIIYQEQFKFDSIARVTIDLAIQLDSLHMAANRAADLINHNNNFLGNPKEGLALFDKYLPIATTLNNYKILARFYINAGDAHFFSKNYKESLVYYEKTIELEKITKENRITGLAYYYSGITHSVTGKFPQAAINYQKAEELFENIQDSTNILSIKTALSFLYGQNGFYKEAKKVRDEAIKYGKIRKQYAMVASNYFNAAIDSKMQNNLEEELENLKLALKNTNLSNRSNIQAPQILSSLVLASLNLNDIRSAKAYFKELETYKNETSDIYREAHLRAVMHLAYTEKDYKKALALNLEYFNLTKNSRYEAKLDSELFLHNTYEKLGNSDKALIHFKNYTKLKDSIINVQKAQALTYYQTVYETEKRDLKIEAQETDIALLNEKDKVKNQYILFSAIGLFTIFGFVLLMRSKNKAKEQRALQEQFSQDLLKSQEAERTRIAKDLHDSVGQQLTLIKKKSQNLEQNEIAALTNNALEEVRSISKGLYPAILKQLGLSASIEQLILTYDEETELFFSSEIDTIDSFFNEPDSLNLYRFIQEVLNNIIKHAEAKSVSVVINKKKNSVNISISDNGKGFDAKNKVKQNSLGLKTITERIRILKGELKINSKLNNGTTIIAKIPTT